MTYQIEALDELITIPVLHMMFLGILVRTSYSSAVSDNCFQGFPGGWGRGIVVGVG